MRIALGLEYDGRGYCGWQSQPDGNTIQDKLQDALSTVAGEMVLVVCAGRTDAGVHAIGQVVHFDVSVVRPMTAWVRGTNAHLPHSIAVRWAQVVDEEFHARFSALRRRYRYILLNRRERPGLASGKVGWSHRQLNVEAMQLAAKFFVGEHDFSAFRSAACQAKSPIKRMHNCSISRQGELIFFDFEANAFLHHMVRNLVGSLVYIGLGRQNPDWIAKIMALKDRRYAAPTFMPDGLYFVEAGYDNKWQLPSFDGNIQLVSQFCVT